MPAPAIELHDLRFGWRPDRPLLAIKHFEVGAGEQVLLHGPSGSGKSTLLGLVAGVLDPAAGRVAVLGQDLSALPRGERDGFRAANIGLIFQLFNLVPYLSVLDNVLLPVRFSPARRVRAADAHREARRLLEALGLRGNEIAARTVTELSVGQQQRVAAARALLGRPSVVVADEPTSALDADARESFLSLLSTECRAAGAAVLLVSHDRTLGPLFDRSVALTDLNPTAGDES